MNERVLHRLAWYDLEQRKSEKQKNIEIPNKQELLIKVEQK